MILKKHVLIEEKIYLLTISDEEEALLAAAAAGGAVLGIWHRELLDQQLPAPYLVEKPEDVTELLAEQVVRRHLGLPWIICETKRLLIREFRSEDAAWVPQKEASCEADLVFCRKELLEAYIANQYHFFEYGIWAVTDKKTGTIIGKAGITDLESEGDREPLREAGYHIFQPYRNKGYAREALKAVLGYGKVVLGFSTLYARIDSSNEKSIRLAESMGFRLIRTDTGSTQVRLLYAVYLKESQDTGGSA